MLARPVIPRILLGPLLVLALLGCPPASPSVDAGAVDAGPPPGCDSPEDCAAAGFDGVCRQSVCRANVRCTEHVECALAERCVDQRCAFSGCTDDSQCGSGKCRREVFACTECGSSADCPRSRPVCQLPSGVCVQCKTDLECPSPGPPYCNAGTCAHCTSDQHCLPGMSCQDGSCHGAQKGAACPVGTLCDLGLMCVNIGANNPVCLEGCGLYVPTCPPSELCLKVVSGANTLIIGRILPPLLAARRWSKQCSATPAASETVRRSRTCKLCQ